MEQQTQTMVLAKEFEMTESQLNTIINTIAKGATVSELKLFLYVAKKSGLDPFTRQIHFVKRKSKQADGSYKETGTIQTGIDGYRAIAERSGTLAGIDDVVYDSEDKNHPEKASVTVYKIVNGNTVKFTASARWNEYFQKNFKTGEAAGLWAKMPYLMLGKCAEALALRKAFPNDLSGLYTNEEMAQADYESAPVKTEIVEAVGHQESNLIQNNTSKALFAEWTKYVDLAGKNRKQSVDILKATLKKEFDKESTRELLEDEARVFIEKLKSTNKRMKAEVKSEVKTEEVESQEQKAEEVKPEDSTSTPEEVTVEQQ